MNVTPQALSFLVPSTHKCVLLLLLLRCLGRQRVQAQRCQCDFRTGCSELRAPHAHCRQAHRRVDSVEE